MKNNKKTYTTYTISVISVSLLLIAGLTSTTISLYAEDMAPVATTPTPITQPEITPPTTQELTEVVAPTITQPEITPTAALTEDATPPAMAKKPLLQPEQPAMPESEAPVVPASSTDDSIKPADASAQITEGPASQPIIVPDVTKPALTEPVVMPASIETSNTQGTDIGAEMGMGEKTTDGETDGEIEKDIE